MIKTSRAIAGIIALSAAFSAFSCSSKSRSKTVSNTTEAVTDATVQRTTASSVPTDTEITWLADYDIYPEGSSQPSPALTLFMNQFGGSVNYIHADHGKIIQRFDEIRNSGGTVDMLPYDISALPEGVSKGLYAPLDPYYSYMGMNEPGLWDGMNDLINRLAYKGQHYVIPYALSDPQILTYSRKLVQEAGLDDPYKLYTEGRWDWEAFMKTMEGFTEKAPAGIKRYGITGWFGQSAIQSTGHSIVAYENGSFRNNIDDPAVGKAEQLMKDIADKGLYRSGWRDFYPTDQSTLFFASADYTLGVSNAKNEELDLMAVPFPKYADAEKQYISCNFDAKMLAAGSTKGAAVAAFIMCERYAATDDKLALSAKEQALAVEKTGNGVNKSFITGEQYNAIQSYLDTSKVTPAFDPAYGMGNRMYSPGNYSYETRGVMDNLETVLLEEPGKADSWDSLRAAMTAIVADEVDKLNKLN